VNEERFRRVKVRGSGLEGALRVVRRARSLLLLGWVALALPRRGLSLFVVGPE
jgi:hypothetical protein